MKQENWLKVFFVMLLVAGCVDLYEENKRLTTPKEEWPWGDVDVVIIQEINGSYVHPPQEYYYNTSIRRWQIHYEINGTIHVSTLDRKYS